MELSRELRRLLEIQQQQNKTLEEAIAAIEATDYLRENEALRGEIATLRAQLEEQNAELQRIDGEKRALEQQLHGLRSGHLQQSRQGWEALFAQEEETAVNRLAGFHRGLHSRLDALRRELDSHGAAAAALLEQLNGLEERSRQFMREASAPIQQGFAGLRQQTAQGVAELEQSPLPPPQPVADRQAASGYAPPPHTQPQQQSKNNMELRIGGRITVIVGMFFILLAVVFGLRYTYMVLQNDLLKGLIAYAIGLLFAGAGEIVSRRQRSPFSIGLSAGGIAILFASTAVSYFTLGILSIPAAIGVCIVITAAALVQSLRYDSQLVAVFALVGGYLPMTAVDASPLMLFSAMAYFLLLSLFVLLVAQRRRWQPLKYFSLAGSYLGAGYLLLLLGGSFFLAAIAFVLANFLLYTAIVLSYPLLQRELLHKSDTVLLGLNTVFANGYLFAVLFRHGYGDLTGVVALVFSLLFFLFARWLRRLLEQDAGARGLFYTVSFAFWVLAVPLHFQPRLISLGWVCQGVGLWIYGILSHRTWYRRAGQALSALCLAAFVFVDTPWWARSFGYPWVGDNLFVWKYSALTLGSLLVLGAVHYRHSGESPFWQGREGRFMRGYQMGVLINLWLYLLYLATRLLVGDGQVYPFNNEFLWLMLCYTALTLGLGLIYRSVPQVQTGAVQGLSTVLYIAGFALVFLTGFLEAFPSRIWLQDTMLLQVLSFILLLALNAGGILALWDFLRRRLRDKSPGQIPLVTSIYALVLVVQLLTVQGGQGLRSLIVSTVVILWALCTILAGFLWRNAALRRFGLGLSLVSITKLFLLDLSFLGSGQRIVSYFVFGLVFIAISFLYQLFSRRLLADVPEAQVGQPGYPADQSGEE